MAEAWKAHRSGPRGQVAEEIGRAIEQVGLSADRSFLRRFPGEISVGQAQRVLIAMAILHRPVLLIADEPTSSLDVISQADILRLLSRLNRKMAMGILYISHDLLSIAGFCHRVAILHEGRIVELAETASIFEAPAHPYTRALIEALPMPPRVAEDRFLTVAAPNGVSIRAASVRERSLMATELEGKWKVI